MVLCYLQTFGYQRRAKKDAWSAGSPGAEDVPLLFNILNNDASILLRLVELYINLMYYVFS